MINPFILYEYVRIVLRFSFRLSAHLCWCSLWGVCLQSPLLKMKSCSPSVSSWTSLHQCWRWRQLLFCCQPCVSCWKSLGQRWSSLVSDLIHHHISGFTGVFGSAAPPVSLPWCFSVRAGLPLARPCPDILHEHMVRLTAVGVFAACTSLSEFLLLFLPVTTGLSFTAHHTDVFRFNLR